MSDRVAMHAYVSGRVQGVFFRACTRDEAQRRGLVGWVRNLPDGRVEALIEGEKQAVAGMLEWLHQGSPMSRVDGVDLDECKVQNLSQFSIES